MTRQWLADPREMCKQHLLGEHFEAHIFLSKMQKHNSLEGFRRGSMFFGAWYIKDRHDQIAKLLKQPHKTPLQITMNEIIEYPLRLPDETDLGKSNSDLYGRCQKCRDVRMGQEWLPI